MATPTFPYTTSSKVSKLVYHLVPGGIQDFRADTVPTAAAVEYYIDYVASVIDLTFQEAGYYIPLEAITDETWVESQTYFVEYLTSIGTAALIGDTLKPAPSMGPAGGLAPGNVYRDQFDSWIARIRSGRMGFRANYRAGTAAEAFILSDRAPMWIDIDNTYSSPVDVMKFWDSASMRDSELQIERGVVGYPLSAGLDRWR